MDIKMQTHIMHVLLECGSIARIMNMRHYLILKKNVTKNAFEIFYLIR